MGDQDEAPKSTTSARSRMRTGKTRGSLKTRGRGGLKTRGSRKTNPKRNLKKISARDRMMSDMNDLKGDKATASSPPSQTNPSIKNPKISTPKPKKPSPKP